MTNPFTLTRAALALYDATQLDRNTAWADIGGPVELARAQNADAAALEIVQLAFWRDTQEVNNIHNCRLVDLNFIRECVKRSDDVAES